MHALIEHIETTASDGYQFRGARFSNGSGNEPRFSLVHIHGMSGGALDNAFVWHLGAAVAKAGGELIAGDTRGAGAITYFNKIDGPDAGGIHGWSVYEDLADSPIDVTAWLALARSSNVYLSGHSLGTVKVTLAIGTHAVNVKGLILLAPADMVALQRRSSDYDAMHDQAQQAVSHGAPRRILDHLHDDWTMISAQTALNIGARGAIGDIINGVDVLHDGPAANVTVPVLVIMGSEDPAMVADPTKACEIFKQTLETSSPDVQLHVINGGDHGFTTTSDEMIKTVLSWIEQLKL